MYDKKSPVLLTRLSAMAILVATTVGLGACSVVPDEVNPIEWYHGVEGWFESDKDQQTRNAARSVESTVPPVPGTDRDYPNLSTVPERPRGVSSSDERRQVNQGLASDRDNARYAKPEPGRPSGVELGAPSAAVPNAVFSEPVAPARGPSPESLEPLPLDPPPPPPPGLRSLLDGSGPDNAGQAAATGQAPAAAAGLEQATFQSTAAEPAASRQMAPPQTVAAPAEARPAEPLPPAAADNGSLVEQTYNAALAAQFDLRPSLTAPEPDVGPLTAPGSLAPPGRLAAPLGALGQIVPHAYVVHFAVGSAQLSGPDRALLRDIARTYKSQGIRAVRIVGHASSRTRETDQITHHLINLRVSSERANAVANELARDGVPRTAMTIAAVSDTEPVYNESMPSGEAGNRRAEIFLAP